MISYTFLGTSAMVPTKERNHVGCFLKIGKVGVLLDCGEGTQRQFRYFGKSPYDVDLILISHWHGDHVLGLGGLLMNLGAANYQRELTLVGPKGTKTFMSHLLRSFAFKTELKLRIVEMKDKDTIDLKEFSVQAFAMQHNIACNAYRIILPKKRKMDKALLKKYKLQGPEVGQLQKGKTITKEGKKIAPAMVGNIEQGKVISYVMDTKKNANISKVIKEADLAIIESTYTDELKDLAEEYAHLNIGQVVELAAKAKVKKLILTHISQRYKKADLKDPLKEAKKNFSDVIFAEDGLSGTLK